MSALLWLPPLRNQTPLGDHLTRHAGVGGWRLANRVVNGKIHRDVGLNVAHGELERGMGTNRLLDLRRELHPAEVLVVRIADLDRNVAQHGVRRDRVDPLDHVLAVDRGPHPVLAGHAERDHAALHRRLVRDRGLDDALRRGPQLQLPLDQRDRCRVDDVAGHGPGEVTVQHEDLALLAANRLPTTTARRVLALQTNELITERGRLVVHRPRVALDDEPGPRQIRAVVLPDLEVDAAARVLDRLDAGRAHRLRDLVEQSVLSVGGKRGQQHHNDGEPAQEFANMGSPGRLDVCDGNGGGMLAAAAAGVKRRKRVQCASQHYFHRLERSRP